MGPVKHGAERPHHRLVVWQKSIEMVTHIYRVTREFPREEMYGLTSQMRRAAVSVPSNIAEGAARTSSKEKLNFFHIARGSLSELETQVEISSALGLLNAIDRDDVRNRLAHISAMLNGLIASRKERG